MQKTTAQRVTSILATILGLNESNISPTHDLQLDLRAGELDIAEIMVNIENEFGINVDQDEFERLTSVQDAINYVADACNRAEDELFTAGPQNPEPTQFCHARTISEAARALDDMFQNPEKAKHITALHACATQLAGNRAHEIYAGDEEARMLPIALAAGMTGCSEVEEAAA